MRKPTPFPPTVYLHLHKDEWTGKPLELWVKGCPCWWCRVVAERLVELKTVQGIRLKEEEDIRYRYGYIHTLYNLTFYGLPDSINEDMLLWVIEHVFHKIQSAQVEWITAHRILNLKRKKD